MAVWNPWRGCHKYSEGCKFCYIHKGDSKRQIDTNDIVKTDKFTAPIDKNKKGEYKIPSGKIIYLCFASDFLILEADGWRNECWRMMKERDDLHFIFLTKRIERFMDCIPDDWNEGYDNVTVGCTIENQEKADARLAIFQRLPIKHKNIICQPLIEAIYLENYLEGVELVVEEQLVAAVDLDPPERVAILRVEVPRDRVGCLVEVLVGVADAVSELGRHDGVIDDGHGETPVGSVQRRRTSL